MAFPAYGTVVPGLASFQASFNGYLMGPNCPLEFQKVEGWDMPDVRSGDAGRPRDHGMFIGLDAMGGREITITSQLASDNVSFAHAYALLAAATIPGGVVETPFFLNLPGFGTLASMARCRRRKMPIDIAFALGSLADVSLQWASTDPRLYAATVQQTVGVPASTAGFSFPFGFPLAFGGGSVAGVISANNTGNIETRPILTITGPCTYPSIANASITGTPTLQFGVTMAAGDRLVVDTDLHAALYFTSGSSFGVTRVQTLQPGSTWWTMPPGVNTLQFLTKDTGPVAGTLAVTYAPAYIL